MRKAISLPRCVTIDTELVHRDGEKRCRRLRAVWERVSARASLPNALALVGIWKGRGKRQHTKPNSHEEGPRFADTSWNAKEKTGGRTLLHPPSLAMACGALATAALPTSACRRLSLTFQQFADLNVQHIAERLKQFRRKCLHASIAPKQTVRCGYVDASARFRYEGVRGHVALSEKLAKPESHGNTIRVDCHA